MREGARLRRGGDAHEGAQGLASASHGGPCNRVHAVVGEGLGTAIATVEAASEKGTATSPHTQQHGHAMARTWGAILIQPHGCHCLRIAHTVPELVHTLLNRP
ncbi:hypothetical protein BP5796_04658 [Coleophoma crateriformis]|uniref:Uncharacterized protein n=1 Tax=Coleophoma crateriformis TaxID=565419 RepID=A0A3D8S9Y7_9HELO|nr:hypothetical protein BP5796_04658 [Coleophoma crateriformis]